MHQELQALLKKFRSEDKEIAGLLVYIEKTGKIIASTYNQKKSKNIVVLRNKYAQLGKTAVTQGVYPRGRWNWGLTSVARYTLFAVNLVGDCVMAGEFVEAKAPSACIEDALEISLMANDILG
jgi:hypothetical protein